MHTQSRPTLRPYGLSPTRLLRPWDFPGKNTGVGCHFLLQAIFPTQGLNLGLLHCWQFLYRLKHHLFAHGSVCMSVLFSQFSSITFSLLLKSNTSTTCCFPNQTNSHFLSFAFAQSLTRLLLCSSEWASLTHAGLVLPQGDAGQQPVLTGGCLC